jgi:hypothetical protein
MIFTTSKLVVLFLERSTNLILIHAKEGRLFDKKAPGFLLGLCHYVALAMLIALPMRKSYFPNE